MATNGRVIPRLKERYESEILPVLREEFGYPNVMAVPRPEKIVLNIGIGEAIQNSKALDAASRDLAIITGQRPAVRRAKKSVAAFKLRAGMPVGLTVTLRGDRMYEFIDRLLNLALPRVRDFRGLSTRSFDGRGNYTLGLREQLIFPEIEYDRIDRVRGLEVTIVTSARTDTEARRLLELMGMPFQRAQVGAGAAS
jgi:large subunit ribosomal protein L5